LALPVNFIAGANVLLRSVLSDTQPVMLNARVPFTTEAFVRGASLLEGSRRYTSLVPAQLAKLAQDAEQDAFVFSMLRKFDAILVGGQQPNWSDVAALRAKGINIVVSYGMTETAGGCIFDGEPLDGVEYRLVEGQIEIAGKTLAEGVGPWFGTNDLGELVDGKLQVLGRSDRVIISGGLKISLDRVEQAAVELPGVDAAVAVALKSSWGESVGIVYRGSPEVDFAELAQISPAAKVLKSVLVSELPTLESGKPDLIACQALLAD
jgi:O-succinylbenzoic acid--CoA ligase